MRCDLYRVLLCLGMLVATCQLGGRAARAAEAPILQQWKGNYQVANFDHLPKGQRDSGSVGITDEKQWATLWKALEYDGKPDEAPKVDFESNVVIFSRNVMHLNRMSIDSVNVVDGRVSLDTSSTYSTRSIETFVYCAMVVVPREGIRQIGNITLP